MRYSANLVKDILEELEKVPIIRHVCTKVGVDHSTFYRWMLKHPTFFKQVQGALFLGRRKLSDTAESVIVNGIQNNEFKSASFWLVHNDPRYMTHATGQQHQLLNDHMVHLLSTDFTKKYTDYPTTFENIFEAFSKFEKGNGKKVTDTMMAMIPCTHIDPDPTSAFVKRFIQACVA